MIYSRFILLEYDLNLFLGYAFSRGTAYDSDAVGEHLGVACAVGAIATVACPALADLGIERTAADGDASSGLDGLGLAFVVAASGDGAECATAKDDTSRTVDALAAVATAGHGQRAATHGEVVVTLDAGCAAVVLFTAVVNAVAAGGNGGISARDDHDGVALDTTGSIGCDADVERAVVNP